MKLNEVLDFEVDLDVNADRKVQQPKTYMCVLHNDDYTDGMALIQLLQKHFKHDQHTAMQIMMRAHEDGSCPCGGPYTKDEAETRAEACMGEAEQHPAIGGGPAPLLISVDEVTH